MATRAQTADALPALGYREVQRGAQRSMAVMATRYGLVLLVNVVSVTYLTRLVGPAVWGTFAVAQLLMSASQEVFGRGFASYLIKKSDEPTPRDVSVVLALQAIVSVGILAILATLKLLSHPLDSAVVWLYAAAALYCFLCALRAVPLAIAERRMRYGTIASVEILEALAFNSVALWCVSRGLILEGLAAAIIARSTLPAALAIVLQPIGSLARIRRDSVTAVLSFGVPFTATSCVGILILSVPVIVVGLIADRRDVGLAQMSFSLYSTLLFPTAAILRIGLSALSRLSKSQDELLAFVDSTLRLMGLWVLPVVVVFSGLSPLWVRKFLGEQWQELPALLILIAPAYMIAGVFWGVLNPALFVQNKGRIVLAYQFAFVAMYAALAAAGTFAFGVRGVALAWLLTHLALYPLLIGRFDSALFRHPVVPQIAIACVSAVTLYRASISRSFVVLTLLGAVYLLIWLLSNRTSIRSFSAGNLRLIFAARIGG